MPRQTLVLVPGLLCDEALWAPQITALADLADILIADTTQDDSMEAMADRLLSAAPDRFALAGLSMGGYVAQAVMRRAPDRVTRLALLDTNARADRPEQIAAREAAIADTRAGRFADVPGQLLPMLVKPDRLRDEAFVAEQIAMMLRVGPEAFIRQQTAIMRRPDGRDDLGRITVPTLCLTGDADALTPPKVHQEMVDRLPPGKGALVVIEDCGHLSTVEQPQAVNAVLRYWLQVG